MRKCKRGAKPYLMHPAQNQRVGSHKKTPEVCIPQRSVRPYDSTPSDCSLCLLARSGRTDWTGGEDRSWCGCPLPLCSKTLGLPGRQELPSQQVFCCVQNSVRLISAENPLGFDHALINRVRPLFHHPPRHRCSDEYHYPVDEGWIWDAEGTSKEG